MRRDLVQNVMQILEDDGARGKTLRHFRGTSPRKDPLFPRCGRGRAHDRFVWTTQEKSTLRLAARILTDHGQADVAKRVMDTFDRA